MKVESTLSTHQTPIIGSERKREKRVGLPNIILEHHSPQSGDIREHRQTTTTTYQPWPLVNYSQTYQANIKSRGAEKGMFPTKVRGGHISPRPFLLLLNGLKHFPNPGLIYVKSPLDVRVNNIFFPELNI